MNPSSMVIAYIDAIEEDQARELKELRWWNRYAKTLTPQEKRRIRQRNYQSFRRPVKPQFKDGDWLRIGPNLEIRIADVQPYKGKYRVRIAHVRDFRISGTPIRTFGEDPTSMQNTLSGAEGANPPEQHGPGEEWLERFAQEAIVKQDTNLREAITG